MSKRSDAINTSLNAYKQQERFDDARDIKGDRGFCVIKKQTKVKKTNCTLEDLIGHIKEC